MTENEKIIYQIEQMKAAIKTLKIKTDGINLHLAAVERQMRTMRQKK
jgi:hypothetical protein